MPLITICSSRETTFLLASAVDAAGLHWQKPHTDADLFLNQIATDKPRFALLNNACLDTPDLLTDIRRSSPNTQIVVCILPNKTTGDKIWQLIDTLEIDMLCTLAELTPCLITLQEGRFYRSSLLDTHPAFSVSESFVGWHDLSTAERRILKALTIGEKGPRIADVLHISPKTVNNHKAKISQKLNISGGPGSLIRFVLLNREKLKQLLD